MNSDPRVTTAQVQGERGQLIGSATLAFIVLLALAVGLIALLRVEAAPPQAPSGLTDIQQPAVSAPDAGAFTLIGWNDLGMHGMDNSYADFALAPPYNTLWAQLVRKEPDGRSTVITEGVRIEYRILENSFSAGKTDFWQYVEPLFGFDLPMDVGLKWAWLGGSMRATGDHFVIEGIPLTPYRDRSPEPIPQNLYPYQLAHLTAKAIATGAILAETTTVAPVSTEIRCDTCHYDGGLRGIATGNFKTNILTLHDQAEGTDLMGSRPVLCADCHGSNALELAGNPELPNLSRAIHHKHAPATNGAPAQTSRAGDPINALLDKGKAPATVAGAGTDDCYLCHPGQQTQSLRDVMYAAGVTCIDCHGGTAQVADPARRPWIDEPRCETCHGAQYAENPDTLYRNSIGHGGLYCEACHGSPHAIVPSTQPNDNIQNIALQGHAGALDDCSLCHALAPTGPGPHGLLADITATPTPTVTATTTPTATATATATVTNTPTATATATPDPTDTPTPTVTVEPPLPQRYALPLITVR